MKCDKCDCIHYHNCFYSPRCPDNDPYEVYEPDTYPHPWTGEPQCNDYASVEEDPDVVDGFDQDALNAVAEQARKETQ